MYPDESERSDNETFFDSFSEHSFDPENEGEISSTSKLVKLKAYDFEPISSTSKVQNKEERSLQIEDQLNVTLNSRVGNLEWCKCKECQLMSNETEYVCCAESNQIPDDLFEGRSLYRDKYLVSIKILFVLCVL